MFIKVSKHAIERYRERLFDYYSTDGEIKHRLIGIVKRGKVICFKPHDLGDCMEIKHKGLSVVVVRHGEESVIITCLGEDRYRSWIKSKGSYPFTSRRLLYGN